MARIPRKGKWFMYDQQRKEVAFVVPEIAEQVLGEVQPLLEEDELITFMREFFSLLPAALEICKEDSPQLYGEFKEKHLHLMAHMCAIVLTMQFKQPLLRKLIEDPSFLCHLIEECGVSKGEEE